MIENSSLRQVSEEEGRNFASQFGCSFFETSSKKAINISSLFDFIGCHCLADKMATSQQSEENRSAEDVHKISKDMADEEKKSESCCTVQ